MQDRALAQEIAQVIYDKKGRDIIVLDVRKLTVICDYMVIATGRTANQVTAMADDVDDRMADLGLNLRRTEGQQNGRWVVLDYGHIMVHLFHQDDRAYYNLERLWEDGTNRLPLPFDQTTLD